MFPHGGSQSVWQNMAIRAAAPCLSSPSSSPSTTSFSGAQRNYSHSLVAPLLASAAVKSAAAGPSLSSLHLKTFSLRIHSPLLALLSSSFTEFEYSPSYNSLPDLLNFKQLPKLSFVFVGSGAPHLYTVFRNSYFRLRVPSRSKHSPVIFHTFVHLEEFRLTNQAVWGRMGCSGCVLVAISLCLSSLSPCISSLYLSRLYSSYSSPLIRILPRSLPHQSHSMISFLSSHFLSLFGSVCPYTASISTGAQRRVPRGSASPSSTDSAASFLSLILHCHDLSHYLLSFSWEINTAGTNHREELAMAEKRKEEKQAISFCRIAARRDQRVEYQTKSMRDDVNRRTSTKSRINSVHECKRKIKD